MSIRIDFDYLRVFEEISHIYFKRTLHADDDDE